jgi:excinuclease ABC subunit A
LEKFAKNQLKILSFGLRRYLETDSDWMRGRIERYQGEVKCTKCKGYRLKPEADAVKIDKLHIGEVCKKSIKDLVIWFKTLSRD